MECNTVGAGAKVPEGIWARTRLMSFADDQARSDVMVVVVGGGGGGIRPFLVCLTCHVPPSSCHERGLNDISIHQTFIRPACTGGAGRQPEAGRLNNWHNLPRARGGGLHLQTPRGFPQAWAPLGSGRARGSAGSKQAERAEGVWGWRELSRRLGEWREAARKLETLEMTVLRCAAGC